MSVIVGSYGPNPLNDYYSIKDETDLKSYVNKLLMEFDSATTKETKDKIAAQLQNLAQTSGSSLTELGASRITSDSIFNPKLTLLAEVPAIPVAANETTIFSNQNQMTGNAATTDVNKAETIDQAKILLNSTEIRELPAGRSLFIEAFNTLEKPHYLTESNIKNLIAAILEALTKIQKQ